MDESSHTAGTTIGPGTTGTGEAMDTVAGGILVEAKGIERITSAERWDSPSQNQSIVVHRTVTPKTWTPTRRAGRWVKYWVYPMTPWATIAARRTRPLSATRVGSVPETSFTG